MNEKLITEFANVLRGEGIGVSPAEVIDAIQVAHLCGVHQRAVLREGMASAMAKSQVDKQVFYSCFDRFFHFDASSIKQPQTQQGSDAGQAGALNSDASDMNQGGLVSEGAGQEGKQPDDDQPLTALLQAGDQAEVALRLAQAAQQVGLSSIRVITQRGIFTRRMMKQMGIDQLDSDIRTLEQGDRLEKRMAAELKAAREQLREDVSDRVQKQFLLHGKKQQRALREKNIRSARLADLNEFRESREIIQRMARKLVALYSRKRTRARKGIPDLRKTLTAGIRFDGVPFDLYWRKKRKDRARVFVICDVSGSVSEAARFLLLFLYTVADVLPRVRAFAFSHQCGEVTDYFREMGPEEAADKVLQQWGGSGTDYGKMLEWFWVGMERELNKETTVIILGDARNNELPARQHYLEKIRNKTRQVLWLNPEGRLRWDTGDSVMSLYSPYCRSITVCNSLEQLERFVHRLTLTAR